MRMLHLIDQEEEGKVYTLCSSFDSQQEAEDALKNGFNDNNWSYRITSETYQAIKKWYDCSHKGCPVTIQMMINQENKIATLLISNNEHQHTSSIVKVGIEEKAKKKIIELERLGIFLIFFGLILIF